MAISLLEFVLKRPVSVKCLPFASVVSLRSWRYCVGARLKFWRRSRVPKQGNRDEVVFLAASPLVTAPPSNLTRLYYNGSAAKSHSTTTQYRQLRRLVRCQSAYRMCMSSLPFFPSSLSPTPFDACYAGYVFTDIGFTWVNSSKTTKSTN